MGKQYLVIYLQYDSGCFARRVWLFTRQLVKFLLLDTEERRPELTRPHTHEKSCV